MSETDIKKYTELLEGLLDKDQEAIKSYKAGEITEAHLDETNLQNRAIVEDIIAQIGFPTISKTSEKAYTSAMLVVLHNNDTVWQQNIVGVLNNAKSEDVHKKDIAFLTDKIRIAQNKPQLYGTQFKKGVDGGLTFLEIEDPENLDKRRQDLGMGTFEDYKKFAEENYR